MSKLLTLSIVACSLSLAYNLFGQEQVEIKEGGKKIEIPPTARLSFVALGKAAGLRFGEATKEEIAELARSFDPGEDTGRIGHQKVAKELEEGESPPRKLSVLVTEEQFAAGLKDMHVPVGFNHFKGMRNVYAGGELKFLLIDETKEDGKKELYLNVPALEPDSETIVFLHPTGKGRTAWKSKPKFSKMELTHEDVIDKPVVVRNMSSERIRVSIVKDTFDLRPGEMRAFDGEIVKGRARVRVGTHSDGKLVVNENVRVVTGTTTVLIVTPSGWSDPKAKKIKMFKAVTRRVNKPEPEELEEGETEEISTAVDTE